MRHARPTACRRGRAAGLRAGGGWEGENRAQEGPCGCGLQGARPGAACAPQVDPPLRRALQGGAGRAEMQRAVSFFSGFLSDFDIGDPDHDLASFVHGDHFAQCAGSEQDAASLEEVFAPDVFAPRVHGPAGAHRRAEMEPCVADHMAEKRWSSTTNLIVLGRDSPCPTAHEEKEEGVEAQWPSSRSVDGHADLVPDRSWLGWLRRRWSPLKEHNLKLLMEHEGGYAQGLMERYLAEQTHMHEVAQAELIKRETQLEDGWSDGEGVHDSPPAVPRGGSGHRSAGVKDEDWLHGCVDTSLSDVDDAKAQRPSRLSEASTTHVNMRSLLLAKESKMLGVSLPIRGDMDVDGLDALRQASNDYADLWTQEHASAENVARGCNTQ